MKFSDIKDKHQQNFLLTAQTGSDFRGYWFDAGGSAFADGVLGELAENLDKLTDDAAKAAALQGKNESYRNEIMQYINTAKIRDEAQNAQNEVLSTECDALEQEVAALKNQESQILTSAETVYRLMQKLQLVAGGHTQ